MSFIVQAPATDFPDVTTQQELALLRMAITELIDLQQKTLEATTEITNG